MRGSAFTNRSIQVEDKTERPLGLNQRRPGPLNRGDRLMEAKIKMIKGEKTRDFDNRPLTTCSE